MASSILIVKLSSMGDVIHTLPAAQALRAAHPKARLGWAVERAHAELLTRQSWLDEVVVWDRGTWPAALDFARRLRQGRWEVAIDFQGLLRSGLIAWLSGARRRVGYAPSAEQAHWFYNERVALETMERHAVERSAQLAEHLGAHCIDVPLARPYLQGAIVPLVPADGQLFPLPSNESEQVEVDRWLARRGFDPTQDRLVVLNPHCRKDANRWPAAQYAKLAGRLLEVPGTRVVLSGGKVASQLCDEIASPHGGAVWRSDGQFGLLGSAELFRRAAVVVTGDTGPMHIAVATGTPVVALFGPANALRTGPYATDAIVLNRHLDCAPCFARKCPLKYNPPRCMELITVNEVFDAVLSRLADRDRVLPGSIA